MPRSKKRTSTEQQVNQAIGRPRSKKYPNMRGFIKPIADTLEQAHLASQRFALIRDLNEKLDVSEKYRKRVESEAEDLRTSHTRLAIERNKLAVEVEDYKRALKRSHDALAEAIESRNRVGRELQDALYTRSELARKLTAICQAAAVINTLSAG